MVSLIFFLLGLDVRPPNKVITQEFSPVAPRPPSGGGGGGGAYDALGDAMHININAGEPEL